MASLAPYILTRPWLTKLLKPVANWYASAAGYRQLGLRADDLINEENEDVLKALGRLDARESYDRIFRIRRAVQLSLQQKILPRTEWTKPEEDVKYLEPLVEQIKKENAEKEALDHLSIVKKH
ncbi:putative ubiquinol-cytochrome C reductase complex 14kD subunit [Podospora didyma]|uniref:Cytochrome b-c1 complex subunit 7 n=1 Tax=Podospora didyma TaxID=330526 RepID=A0AAE0KJL9_9PEZI|nr:putative ubiquinol-cytochrome C reductase complex 14kD subunit [Podospora didyma]